MSHSEAQSSEPVATEEEVERLHSAGQPAEDHPRVLKHNDTFVMLDSLGGICPTPRGKQGLFHRGTRYLSGWLMALEGHRPLLLSSTVQETNDQLVVELTNPEMQREGSGKLELGTLHLSAVKLLWNARFHQRLSVRNYGMTKVSITLTLYFAADFIDLFEIRGASRARRGEVLAPDVKEREVCFTYRGLDRVGRKSHIRFLTPPTELTAGRARFRLELPPHESQVIDVSVDCEEQGQAVEPVTFPEAREAVESHAARDQAWSCHVQSSHGPFNDLIHRSMSDLHLLTTETEHGLYPYAGVPWFSTPFGRDGIITALECLWIKPKLAAGVLSFLAATQATEVNPEQDAEPGKILHEARDGEMAALKEIPFGRYYGTIDATPLFVLLAGAYYERTCDMELIESIWPNIKAALRWIDEWGDIDGDGFVEYQRKSESGLVQQGWKDSNDSVHHADGRPAEGPIALCEVQGYVYAARQAGARIADLMEEPELAQRLREQAEGLRHHFEEMFWCEDIGTYALALDGKKERCAVRASNAGHCLLAGLVQPERAYRTAGTLLNPTSWSGWGIRTLDSQEVRYNPMAYHNGSIWPHDNALIAYGLSRYGLREQAVRIMTGLFESSTYFDLNRLPELFCGFPRQPGQSPVLYPAACAPQAWASASIFLLLQACLGLEIDGAEQRILFTRPRLPSYLRELRITNLAVGTGHIDLLLVRHEDDVGINVLRREGDVRMMILK